MGVGSYTIFLNLLVSLKRDFIKAIQSERFIKKMPLPLSGLRMAKFIVTLSILIFLRSKLNSFKSKSM